METTESSELIVLSGMKKVAARRMVEAWQAPVFHLQLEVNMTQALKVKQVAEQATVTDVITKSVAQSLIKHPAVNSHVTEEGIVLFREANVGIAVATQKGLTVPVIHSADQRTLSEIAQNRRDVVSRARDGKLTREDISGGTFSISNLGMMGISSFDAILNIPQSAILAVGKTEKKYLHNDGNPEWVDIATFTLTCDHRSLDGATAAAFMSEFKSQLESEL